MIKVKIKILITDTVKRRDFVNEIDEIKKETSKKRSYERKLMEMKKHGTQLVHKDTSFSDIANLKPDFMKERDWRTI